MNEVQMMKAAYFTHPGGVNQIQVGQLPVPTIGPTDVLVKIQEAAVDRVDAYVRSGTFQTPLKPQQVIGRGRKGNRCESGYGSSSFSRW